MYIYIYILIFPSAMMFFSDVKGIWTSSVFSIIVLFATFMRTILVFSIL